MADEACRWEVAACRAVVAVDAVDDVRRSGGSPTLDNTVDSLKQQQPITLSPQLRL